MIDGFPTRRGHLAFAIACTFFCMPASAAPLVLVVPNDAGRVSGWIDEAPLDDALKAFAAATGVRIQLEGHAFRTVTAGFEHVPPEQALDAILGSHPSIRFYSSRDSRHLSEVWIGEKTSSPAPVSSGPPPPRKAAATERSLAERDLEDPDPGIRALALAELLEAADDADLPTLRRVALEDTDPDVRALALDGYFIARARDNVRSRRVLLRALQDEDPVNRVLVIDALAALLDAPGAARDVEAALESALEDEDAEVRLAAVEGLQQWVDYGVE